MELNALQSKIGRAKGLGSAKTGVEHWWVQRLTAIALVPLSVWFVFSLIRAMLFPTAVNVAEWLASPFVAIALIIFIVTMFYHAKLGLQVVIEDYVKTSGRKFTLLILNSFGCIICAVLSIMAVLKLHFLDVVASSL